jgi:putative ubiquitin-RnfH superfamily antitoxin RatB of RatAB toxin-antitoxin module
MLSTITIEVAYATAEQQIILTCQVATNATIATAIEESGILNLFPTIDLACASVGVFSVPKKLSDKLMAGDRVEIYRELLFDPHVARRVRAQHAKKLSAD